MKKTITPTLLVAALLVAAANLTAHAQTKPAPQPRYADRVGDNPTTEADLLTVGSYLSLITAGNTEKAKLLLADTYRSYGPGAADSATRDQAMTGWQQRWAPVKVGRSEHGDWGLVKKSTNLPRYHLGLDIIPVNRA